MQPDLRLPAVDGRFYPEHPAELARELELLLKNRSRRRAARLLVVPHAGYMYSGRVAGATYAQAEVPETVVVLGPNHTGYGAPAAVWASGAWRIPGTDVPIAQDLARALVRATALNDDPYAHLREHSIEVQLPFLAACQPSLRIVPICLARLGLSDCRELGEKLAAVISGWHVPVLLVASTDMSHYITAERAAELDRLAIDCIQRLDAQGLYAQVVENEISMCGFVPTTVGIFAARALGATTAELIDYAHSGLVSGDFERVVGYAGLRAS